MKREELSKELVLNASMKLFEVFWLGYYIPLKTQDVAFNKEEPKLFLKVTSALRPFFTFLAELDIWTFPGSEKSNFYEKVIEDCLTRDGRQRLFGSHPGRLPDKWKRRLDAVEAKRKLDWEAKNKTKRH